MGPKSTKDMHKKKNHTLKSMWLIRSRKTNNQPIKTKVANKYIFNDFFQIFLVLIHRIISHSWFINKCSCLVRVCGIGAPFNWRNCPYPKVKSYYYIRWLKLRGRWSTFRGESLPIISRLSSIAPLRPLYFLWLFKTFHFQQNTIVN